MRKALVVSAVALGMLAAVPAAGAVTINVTTPQDDFGGSAANCSLREAITAAQTDMAMDGCQAGSGADVISLPAGEYRITRAGPGEDSNETGDFDVFGTDALTIHPAGTEAKVGVNGNGRDRVFDQQGDNSLAIQAVQITGGLLTGPNDGAGIVNTVGMLSLDGVTVSGNSNDVSGAGVAVYSNLSMINSTVSGNSTKGSGGGLYFAGGASGTVKSSTIADNTADSDSTGGGDGGGFADAGAASINFHNVIDAANKDLSPNPGDKSPDCASGPFYFPRFVLSNQAIGAGNCLVGFGHPGNKVVPDAMIGPLADNSGQTPTHALLIGSPAIGAGGKVVPDTCPTLDQNGRVRPANSCDIGAVQYFEPPPPPPLATVKVRFVKIKPKPLKLRRGKKAKKVRVRVKSTGTGVAINTKVCIKPGKRVRKSIKVKSRYCRRTGSLVDGARTVKFRFKAKRNATRKKFRIETVLKTTGVAPKTRRIAIRVR